MDPNLHTSTCCFIVSRLSIQGIFRIFFPVVPHRAEGTIVSILLLKLHLNINFNENYLIQVLYKWKNLLLKIFAALDRFLTGNFGPLWYIPSCCGILSSKIWPFSRNELVNGITFKVNEKILAEFLFSGNNLFETFPPAI